MKPNSQKEPQKELFKIPLRSILDSRQELYQLADILEWEKLEKEFGKSFTEGVGRPGIASRLLIGLHYLKYVYNLSDEQLCERFRENPYWQYFCGWEYFEYKLPLDPSSMSRWRGGRKIEDFQELLKATIEAAFKSKFLKKKDIEVVNVDTTVQEKNIIYPTDSRSMRRVLIKLVKECKLSGLELRQSYVRVSKIALIKACRYAAARQMKRAKAQIKKIRCYLGRVCREIRKGIAMQESLTLRFEELLRIADKLIEQSKDPKTKNKIYSVHEPAVECIAKGKAHKKYEFGVKVSVVATSKKGIVLSCDTCPNTPYDGRTLDASLKSAEMNLNREQMIKRAYVDKGYRGHNYQGEIIVMNSGQRPKITKIKKELKRRSSIEPIIGHMKNSCRMARNYLKGAFGDSINAILSAAAHNLRLILAQIRLFAQIFDYLAKFILNIKAAFSYLTVQKIKLDYR